MGQELLTTDRNPPPANQVDVDGQVLEEAITRMLAVGDLLQVILFGSRARGDAQPDSDYDLLVIEESAYDLQFWLDAETAAGALSLAADVKRITLAIVATESPDDPEGQMRLLVCMIAWRC